MICLLSSFMISVAVSRPSDRVASLLKRSYIITSAIALWGKLGDAKKEIDATNKQITEVSADMKEVKTQMETIKEYLLARGIIPPGH